MASDDQEVAAQQARRSAMAAERRAFLRIAVATIGIIPAALLLVWVDLGDLLASPRQLVEAMATKSRFVASAILAAFFFWGLARMGAGRVLHRILDTIGNIALPVILGLLFGATAGIFVFSTTPDVPNRAPSRSSQAVQSGALVAGVAGAAVTLWLSDRRRRTDEDTHALNLRRAEEDRFATAVELLGNSSAAVRVGALHSLDDLAQNSPSRCQTVIDVMCAYLRQPFAHPDWNPNRTWSEKASQAADREREVRATATRLFTRILAPTNSELPTYSVDLTGAQIDSISMHGRKFALSAAGARFHGYVGLMSSEIHGGNLTAAQFKGIVNGGGMIMRDSAWWQEVQFHDAAILTGARFEQPLKAAGAKFHGYADLTAAKFIGAVDLAGSKFMGIAEFGDVRFEGGLSFRIGPL